MNTDAHANKFRSKIINEYHPAYNVRLASWGVIKCRSCPRKQAPADFIIPYVTLSISFEKNSSIGEVELIREICKMSCETTLRQFFGMFENAIKVLQEKDNVELQKLPIGARICALFSGKVPLSKINPHFSENDSEKETDAKRQFMIAFLMKCILDFDTLRGLCLMPPEGCSLDQWQCLAGPCKSHSLRCQNIKLVQAFRFLNGKKDGLEPGYYERFEKAWGKFKRSKSKNKEKKLGSNSPLMLFPVNILHESVGQAITGERPELKDYIDKLFLCCEHFKVVEKDSCLGKRSLQSFSLENINQELANGNVVFSWGRSTPKNFRFAAKLLELAGKSSGFNLALPQPIVNQQVSEKISEAVVGMVQRLDGITFIQDNVDNSSLGEKSETQMTNT